MSLLDTAFDLLSTTLALYFAQIRFRARMPLFGHAMTASALLALCFSVRSMELPANICAAAYVLFYMKSLSILQQHGLNDGSQS